MRPNKKIRKSASRFRSEAGFTLVELITIISVLGLLTSMLIVYGRSSGKQIVLFREQAKIIGVLAQAKSLAIQAKIAAEGTPCAYGVSFLASENKYILFKDLNADCSFSDKRYSGAGETVSEYSLDPLVQFQNLVVTDVAFVPPNPDVVISPTQDETTIEVIPKAGGNVVKVKINSAGQITAQ
ncbi:MAG: type II secretion system protein [Parcubacteria group bacterium]|nr:type II secretion system protein [Parcubacteria group bacterium]